MWYLLGRDRRERVNYDFQTLLTCFRRVNESKCRWSLCIWVMYLNHDCRHDFNLYYLKSARPELVDRYFFPFRLNLNWRYIIFHVSATTSKTFKVSAIHSMQNREIRAASKFCFSSGKKSLCYVPLTQLVGMWFVRIQDVSTSELFRVNQFC